jgi:hypothetical protein
MESIFGQYILQTRYRRWVHAALSKTLLNSALPLLLHLALDSRNELERGCLYIEITKNSFLTFYVEVIDVPNLTEIYYLKTTSE